MSAPYVFDDFFSSGKLESVSPFLKPSSKKWGKNLPLKSAIISAIFLFISFITHFFFPPISPLFLLGVYFLSGTPALIESIEDLRNFTINIDVLMTLAALLSALIGSALEGGLLLVLFELSGAMEKSVTEKTKGALFALKEISPPTAFVVEEDHSLCERNVKEIRVGTTLLIKAGELIPLDGIVLSGETSINTSHLTGESLPIRKSVDDHVQAGSTNLEGSITIRVTRTSSHSTLAQIIKLITEAQASKPKIQRFLDRFGKWYASIIIALAFFFALFLPFLFSLPFLGEGGSIYRALTFLIAASPCALILATPTAYLSAISSCTRKGVLLKGGGILDALTRCSVIAFDKTGTLTTGELQCTSIEPINTSFDIKTAIQIAASLESRTVHPIARAINRYAANAPLYPVTHFHAKAGLGIEGKVELFGKTLLVTIGHPSYVLQGEKISIPQKEGHTTSLLRINNHFFLFYFTDTLRPKITETLSHLQDKNVIMLTGDHQKNAEYIAKKLDIKTFFSNLRPEDKLNKVIELNEKSEVIMVGDGINDAPALARSTVGISMGKIGSATAIRASDIVFLQDDCSMLPWLLKKGKQTMRVLKENLSLAMGVILLTTTPALLGWVPLYLAVLLHEGGTLLVGLNSLRLLKK